MSESLGKRFHCPHQMKRRLTPSQFSTSIYLAQLASRSGVTQHLPPSGFGPRRSFTRANSSDSPATSESDDASSQAGRWILKKFSLPFEPLGPHRSWEIEKSERAKRNGEREARWRVSVRPDRFRIASVACSRPHPVSLSPLSLWSGHLHRDRPDAIGCHHRGGKKNSTCVQGSSSK